MSLRFFGNVLCVNKHDWHTSGPIRSVFFLPVAATLLNQFDKLEKTQTWRSGKLFSRLSVPPNCV